mmetsp:Transcript_12668/g.1903  ORF Transcript_12668/g.1903 Transcript_12668/m.1903 type:complete len:93 (+) Transcript_12668:209-487(+)
MAFLRKIVHLVKIVIPSWKCREIGVLIILTISLVIRTWLSIEISDVNGKIVKAIVDRELVTFVKRTVNLALFAIPGSLINSGLDYLSHTLAI